MWSDRLIIMWNHLAQPGLTQHNLVSPSPLRFHPAPLGFSATCLKMLVMRFADVQWPAPLSLILHFAVQYKFLVVVFIIIIIIHPVHLGFIQCTLVSPSKPRSHPVNLGYTQPTLVSPSPPWFHPAHLGFTKPTLVSPSQPWLVNLGYTQPTLVSSSPLWFHPGYLGFTQPKLVSLSPPWFHPAYLGFTQPKLVSLSPPWFHPAYLGFTHTKLVSLSPPWFHPAYLGFPPAYLWFPLAHLGFTHTLVFRNTLWQVQPYWVFLQIHFFSAVSKHIRTPQHIFQCSHTVPVGTVHNMCTKNLYWLSPQYFL